MPKSPKRCASNEHPTGIVKTDRGWRAFVRVHPGPGGLLSKCFPPATSVTVMRRWREDQRVRARHGLPPEPSSATLRADVRDYLAQVQTMPTLRDRRDDLALWQKVFGPERERKTITAGEIRTQLETWRAEGYAANTCNHRRTALMHLWSVLDGKAAPNPARDVPRYADDSQNAPPRALSATAIELLLYFMPASQTKARISLMACTGWPQAQIMKLTPTDITWNTAVFVRARRKGKGAAGVWLPLLPGAWAALEAFKKIGAWGDFSTSSMRNSLRRAAKNATGRVMMPLALSTELADVTPYQLRHSFGTLIAGITQDDRAVQTLLQHADIRTTHRYTSATADPRALAALRKVTMELQRADNQPEAVDSKG
jgi:integrase